MQKPARVQGFYRDSINLAIKYAAFLWLQSSMEREQVIPAQVADAPKACGDLFRCARKFRNGCPHAMAHLWHSRARLVGALARQPTNANIIMAGLISEQAWCTPVFSFWQKTVETPTRIIVSQGSFILTLKDRIDTIYSDCSLAFIWVFDLSYCFY